MFIEATGQHIKARGGVSISVSTCIRTSGFVLRTETRCRFRVCCASRRRRKASSSAEWRREGALASCEATVHCVGQRDSREMLP